MFSKLKQKLRSSTSTSTPLSSLEFTDLIFHEELGRGGYGVVHRVTFKTPQPGLTQAASKQLREENLKEEVNIMQTLDHPNIVKLYGSMAAPMSLYIVLLEYAPNGTVRDYLTKHEGHRIPIYLPKKWARESALALLYLHQQRVLHRDVKASNCLLFKGNLLKLSDFGLSREMIDSETTSTAKGTWRYMAPEINTDHHFSFKSDIYAYGMLVLEIGTGKVPFDGLQSFNVMYRVSAENLKPTIPPDFPVDLGDFIWRCWSPAPQYRPELVEALQVTDGLPDDSDTSQGESASASSAVHSVKQWGLVTVFGKEGDAEEEFQLASNIAVCSNGDVVVVDFPLWRGIPEDKRPPRRVFIYTSNGKFKVTLNPEDQPEAHLVSPADIAITSHNQIAVIDSKSKYVRLFNETGTYLHSFSVLSDNDDPNTHVQPWSISVACNGDILVGCLTRKVITVHESHYGRLINTVNLSIRPHFITTNSKQQIIVCSAWDVHNVQIISYAGDVIVSLDSFSVDGKPGVPSGLTCNEDDCIYIAVCRFDPANGNYYTGTGHIHQYSPWGRFVRCIITGMHFPRGITWHGNAIYVANDKSVLVYSQK